MSLVSFVGPKPNLLDINQVNPPMRLEVAQPVLDSGRHGQAVRHRAPHPWQVPQQHAGHHLSAVLGLRRRRGQAGVAVRRSGRCDPRRQEHPHHHDRRCQRHPDGDPGPAGAQRRAPASGARRPAHHGRPGGGDRQCPRGAPFRGLAGYGAEAVHPYLALETLCDLHQHLSGDLGAEKAIYNYIKAVGKGLSKIMSKMGVSTYMSYCGAQLFEAIGINSDTVEQVLPRHPQPGRGHRRVRDRRGGHPNAQGGLRRRPGAGETMLDAGGEYAWRTRGEEHMWSPDAIAKLQHSTRANNWNTYKEYAQLINDQSRRHMTLRGLFEFRSIRRKAIRSTRSSRPARSSSASRPAPCRWARFPPRPMPRWRWP
jgi:glutamate synthase (NADPH/NADH) large chain